MLCANSFCMNKNLYSAHDLARHLNTNVFPKTGKVEKNKYSDLASIKTIYKNKKTREENLLYIFSKNTKNGNCWLVAWEAFHMAFGTYGDSSFYTERYLRKNDKIKEVWELLEKKLEKELQK